MKRASLGTFLGLLFTALSVTGCSSSTLVSPLNSKCEKAVANIMAKCGTCFATSTSSTSSRGNTSCRQALMSMCEPAGTWSSSSSSSSLTSSPDAFLDCVGNATSCDVILLCS